MTPTPARPALTAAECDQQAKRMTAARATLILDQPFFGTLALQMPLVADPTTPTAWTDGTRIGYNPAYTATLTGQQLQGLLCHEVLHPALGHNWRRDGRDPQQWNEAADYAINPQVQDAGLILPPNALIDASFAGQPAEQIYAARFRPQPQPKPGDDQDDQDDEDGDNNGDNPDPAGQGKPGNPGPGQAPPAPDAPPAPGEVRDAPADGPTEAEQKVKVIQAAQAARMQGKLPGGIARLVDELKRSKVDWKSLLRQFVQQTAAADYSWSQPNRRYMAAGLYLPSLRSESMPAIAAGIDASGSISQDEFNDYAAELSAILDECQPEELVTIPFDTRVKSAEVGHYRPGDTIKIETQAGGGTDFRPVFEHIETDGIAPACLIMLTDLEGSFPNEPPEYPVLWISTNPNKEYEAPFGLTVPMDS